MSDFDDKATVTGAIASFNNGADEVPVDSGTFYIAPSQSGTGTPSPSNPRPIVGYTGMTIYQTGKNLLHNEMEDGTTGGIDYSLNSDGSIDCSGTVSNVNSTRILATNIKLPVGSYVLSGADSSINLRCVVYAKDGTSANRNDTGSGVTVSITADTDYIEFRVKARTNAEVVSTTIYPMFEVGSTPSQFEAYKAKTPIVDAFGRTIYGGERKTDGTLTETHGAPVTFTGASGENWQYSVNNSGTKHRVWIYVGDSKAGSNNLAGNIIVPDTSKSGYPDEYNAWVNTANSLIIGVPLSITSASDWKTFLSSNNLSVCYELATPNEYTLSPISLSTYYGDNNVWCDTGDTELTYYKSGYGYTSVTVNQKNGNDELIDSKTVKLHKVIYGGEVDVIQGTAKPKNLISPPEYTANTPTLCWDLGEDKTFDSVTLSFLATNTVVNSNVAAIVDYRKNDGTHQYRTLANFKNENGVAFAAQTPNSGRFRNSYVSVSGITFRYVYIYYEYNTYSFISTDSMSEWQLELGSSASDYAPYFEPFTFPPISMETVEGTNVLYANEGDSTVTYRRSAD